MLPYLDKKFRNTTGTANLKYKERLVLQSIRYVVNIFPCRILLVVITMNKKFCFDKAKGKHGYTVINNNRSLHKTDERITIKSD